VIFSSWFRTLPFIANTVYLDPVLVYIALLVSVDCAVLEYSRRASRRWEALCCARGGKAHRVSGTGIATSGQKDGILGKGVFSRRCALGGWAQAIFVEIIARAPPERSLSVWDVFVSAVAADEHLPSVILIHVPHRAAMPASNPTADSTTFHFPLARSSLILFGFGFVH
jgi:hypothetical protein